MLRTLLRHIRLENRGTAAVELAILAPVLGALITSAWDFGNALVQQERITSAARAGAQFALINSSDSTDYTGMVQAARNDATDSTSALTVTAQSVCKCPTGSTVSCSSGTCTGGSVRTYAQLTVSEQYTTLVTYPFAPNPLNLSSTVFLRVK